MQKNIWNSFRISISKVLVSGVVTLLALGTNAAMVANHAAVAATASGVDVFLKGDVNSEILWFARTIYSETKTAEEQTLVAWVIRNRVESALYPETYKEVVLQKGQFSGMHPSDAQYWTNVTLGFEDHSPSWDSAVSIAKAVYFADPILRPLPKTVMHFYSPVSVTRTPSWAEGLEPAHTVRDAKTNSVRFAFFADIN